MKCLEIAVAKTSEAIYQRLLSCRCFKQMLTMPNAAKIRPSIFDVDRRSSISMSMSMIDHRSSMLTVEVRCRCRQATVEVRCRCRQATVEVRCRCRQATVEGRCRCRQATVEVRCRCRQATVEVRCRCRQATVEVRCRCRQATVEVRCRCGHLLVVCSTCLVSQSD